MTVEFFLGKFCSKSAFAWAKNPTPIPPLLCWKWVWNILSHPRIVLLSWLAIQGHLSIIDFLISRHISVDNSCGLCIESTENSYHVLRNCGKAKEFWRSLGMVDSFFNSHNSFYFCASSVTHFPALLFTLVYLGILFPMDVGVFG